MIAATACVLLASDVNAIPINSAASCVPDKARSILNAAEHCISVYVRINIALNNLKLHTDQ